MISIVDIQSLTELTGTVLGTDLLHILREDDGLLMSNKEKASLFASSLFEAPAKLSAIKERLESLKASAEVLFNHTFDTKSHVDSTYVSKTTLENTTPSLLAYSEMDNLISKYVDEDNLTEKGASVRQEAIRLADEMTDFAGAAVVGINQSGGGGNTTPTETTPKG